MNHRKLLIIATCIFCLASCKKDETTTVLPSLEGVLDFTVPEYVNPNARVLMTPRGVIHPEGKEVGYYWKVITTRPDPDTTRYENGLDKNGNPSDGTFDFTFSDTTKTYKITCYAFAEGYTYTSATISSTVVKGGKNGSITGLRPDDYVTIGNTDWMCRNVEDITAGVPYANCKAMSDVFGRYYTYEEAMKICPEGWELPTDADWTALAKAAGGDAEKAHQDIKGVAAALMGNAYFNDELMWQYWPVVGEITNTTGISMIPTGYVMLNNKAADPVENEFMEGTYPNAQFKGYKEYAAFWTADKVDGEEGMAYYRYVICDQPDLLIGKTSTTSFGASVRCIRRK